MIRQIGGTPKMWILGVCLGLPKLIQGVPVPPYGKQSASKRSAHRQGAVANPPPSANNRSRIGLTVIRF